MAAGKKEAVVLFERARYVDESGEVHEADKGEKVTLSGEEFDRLEKLGAVASPRSKAAKSAAEEADDTSGEGDQPPEGEEPPAE